MIQPIVQPDTQTIKKYSELVVGDFIVRVKGFKSLIGKRYKVLSITLTDAYLQDVETNRCFNYSNSWIVTDFVKVSNKGGQTNGNEIVG